MAFVALCQFLQHARWSTWRKNSLRVRRCESCLQTRWLLAAVVAERALLNNQIYRIMLFRRSFPIQTSRGSKLIRLSSTFHHGWILDSFQMGDATCYSRYSDSQSWFGPGLGEIRNIKWSILIGGSSTEKREIMFDARSSVPKHMQQLGRQSRRTWCLEWQLNPHSITLQVAMHAMLTCIVASFLKRKPQHPALQPGRWQCWWAGHRCHCWPHCEADLLLREGHQGSKKRPAKRISKWIAFF